MGLLTLWSPAKSPFRSLLAVYIIRTIVIVGCAVSSSLLYPRSSPFGYDTSTSHLIDPNDEEGSIHLGFPNTQYFWRSARTRLSAALTRWDAIYFINTGRRGGYLYEQEWAFARAPGLAVRAIEVTILKIRGNTEGRLFDIASWALVSAVVSCTAHALSSIILYQLVRTIFQPNDGGNRTEDLKANKKLTKVDSLAFMTAVLQILSPAGIFLSAPYAESLFSLLSFLGYWLFCRALSSSVSEFSYALQMVSAGSCFGLSCLVRSNGVLNGVLFLGELVINAQALLRGTDVPRYLGRCVAIGVSGILVGVGMLWLQYEGWRTYCSNEATRGWCLKTLPSIYTFVQEHYWNVGFLRYWTISNLPLFMLALPVLGTLLWTSISALQAKSLDDVSTGFSHITVSTRAGSQVTHDSPGLGSLKRLAVPQLLLSILAISNYHIQIITRLSSGLAIWYIILASQLLAESSNSSQGSPAKRTTTDQPTKSNWRSWGGGVIRWNIGYAIVQAILFGGFLPPA